MKKCVGHKIKPSFHAIFLKILESEIKKSNKSLLAWNLPVQVSFFQKVWSGATSGLLLPDIDKQIGVILSKSL